MTAKTALASAKQKLRTHAPYIIATVSTAITIATVIYFNTKETADHTLEFSDEDYQAMKNGGINLTYWIDGAKYDLSRRVVTSTEA